MEDFKYLKDDKIVKEYKELLDRIKLYNHHYYNLNESLITDYEFDVLLKKLEKLEEKYPNIKDENSPTLKVGGKANDKFKKIKHSKSMLSLSNTYNINEIDNFFKRIEKLIDETFSYVLELKLDGLSISLIYEKGILKRAITRGDGNIGEDVTENILQISSIPKILNSRVDIEVRGEIVLPISEFNRINNEKKENGELPFANPRNAASGTLRQLDSKIVKERNLDCYIYNLQNPEKFNIYTHIDSINFLKELGFKTTDVFEKFNEIEKLEERINYWENNRFNLDFETDGLVIKIDEIKHYEKLGYTSKSPRWAIAYKFKAEEKETKILDVTYQVGRTGIITPVAELEEVELAKTYVKRASLHNFDEIDRLGIKINDIVLVKKAAEIIPQVVSVVLSKRDDKVLDIIKPINCPNCNSILYKDDENVAYKCKNKNCSEIIKRKIEYFVSRDALNIQGLGYKLIQKFVDLGLLKDFLDLYELKNKREYLINLDKMGEKSVDNLLNNIEKSIDAPFSNIFYSLGIEYVGKTTSKLLVEKFNDIDTIMTLDIDILKNIDGVGEKVATSIYNYFRDEESKNIVKKLKEIGFNLIHIKKEISNHPFITNKNFLATGKLIKYKRDEIKEVILKNGGNFLSSVTKNLDYLIVGENAGSKLEKANKLDVKVITEDEFIEILNKI